MNSFWLSILCIVEVWIRTLYFPCLAWIRTL